MKTKEWYNWAGYRAPNSLWDEELEYFAIRSQAALFDISPMVKYRIEGPDAEAYLNRVTLRDVAKLRPAACIIPHGATTRATCWTTAHCSVSPRTASACAARSGICRGCSTAPSASMSSSRRRPKRSPGWRLQGPTSFAVLRDAGFAGVERLKLFDLADFPHEGGTVTISRTGFTGDLGYELFAPAELALIAVGPADGGRRNLMASAPSAITRSTAPASRPG